MRLVILLGLMTVTFGGCTSSNSSTSSPVSCQSTVIALCKAACACGGKTDASAACSLGNPVDGGGGGSSRWATESECELFFAFECAKPSPVGFSYAACNNALSIASCVSTVDGPALAFPAACSVPVPEGGVDSAM